MCMGVSSQIGTCVEGRIEGRCVEGCPVGMVFDVLHLIDVIILDVMVRGVVGFFANLVLATLVIDSPAIVLRVVRSGRSRSSGGDGDWGSDSNRLWTI